MFSKKGNVDTGHMTPPHSLILDFLGEGTINRVVDYLMEKRPFDSTKEEIMKETGVSRNTFFRVWGQIEQFHMVRKVRTVGRASLYLLNDDSPVVKKLLELERALIEEHLNENAPKVRSIAAR